MSNIQAQILGVFIQVNRKIEHVQLKKRINNAARKARRRLKRIARDRFIVLRLRKT